MLGVHPITLVVLLTMFCLSGASDVFMDGVPLQNNEGLGSIHELLRGVRQTATTNAINSTLQALARHVILQDTFIQERIRSGGASGIKQVRVDNQGSRPYYSASFSGSRMCAMHEHSNNIRVVGMGEFIAVLNGVEFRTRHNDYELKKPHATSSAYNAVQDIDYPEVPPAVTGKATVAEQVTEMREWFKAWRDQDTSVRDYRPYFKPVLCYLEGAWTTSVNIQEAFESDRHSYDAYSWFDLAEKIRFTSYAGKKDSFENYAWLPATIMETVNGNLIPAQWNYRILCHPLKNDLKTNRLKVVDDLRARMAYDRTVNQHANSRAARFQLAPVDADTWTHQSKRYDLLDQLMGEVPGANNYPADFGDDSLGEVTKKWTDSSKNQNAGYYNRWFKTATPDAMGESAQHRGFADENVFMARTTNPDIAPMFIEKCLKPDYLQCTVYEQRWTYAIPMEIIYLTPLYKWNPYDITYKGVFNSANGLTVNANGRNGAQNKPYDGTNSKKFYQTPFSFYSNDDGSGDPADTAEGGVYVLNNNGQANKVAASGTRISLPDIPGVGKLRVRYPIMPIHQEGSAFWKELEALKDIVLNPKTQKDKRYEDLPTGSGGSTGTIPTDTSQMGPLQLKTSTASPEFAFHVHYINLSPTQALHFKTLGNSVTVTSEIASGHSHTFILTNNVNGKFAYTKCDGQEKCFDGHPNKILYGDV